MAVTLEALVRHFKDTRAIYPPAGVAVAADPWRGG